MSYNHRIGLTLPHVENGKRHPVIDVAPYAADLVVL